MAVLALNTSAYRNAVSRLHREVSQEMFHDLWPQLPVWEVPITSVTNGVHLPSWLNGDLALLYDQYLEPDWRERFNDPAIWEQVEGHSGRRTAGSAPPAQAPADHLRARAPARVGACAGRRRAAGGPALQRSAGSRTRSPSDSRGASPPTSAPRCSSATSSG